MSDIFKEVDEELQRDRALSLWRRYGKYVIGAAVAIVAATTAYVLITDYQASQRAANAQRYLSALDLAADGARLDAADQLAKFAADAPPGYSALARLQQAGFLVEEGRVPEAVSVYDALAADTAVDEVYRELGLVLSVLHQVDEGDSAGLLGRIEPVANGDGPWRHTATELAALLAQRGGDFAKAKEFYSQLTDDNTAPRSARERAAELLSVLGG
ncbi:MAG: tetratricopeptide repeat protein [Alphaproteobacteria bacterium]|nr:tetratricopeptide repeat protein [Alphaproteobacteria bacterium]